MGKATLLDRVAQALIALTALICLGNGLMMLIAPLKWYWSVPGVPTTGPANGHFIRDIGLAYLTCAGLLAYAAISPSGRWLAAAAGATWLTAHGLLHVWEVASGICSVSRFRGDAPAVLGPPLMVLAGLGILLAHARNRRVGV